MSDYKHMSIEDFHNGDFQDLQEGDLILDVRTAAEFDEFRIKGSLNISHEQVASRISELEGYKRIFILCRRGARAQVALNDLAQLKPDFNWVCISDGGTERWIDQNFPTES